MVGMDEKKTAFRLAYNALNAHPNPEYTSEYFRRVCGEFGEISAGAKGNRLLPFLLSAIYDYLTMEAKEAAKP